jgi:hypothetical protein
MARIIRYEVATKRGVKGSIFAESLKQAKAIASSKGLVRSSVRLSKVSG